MNKLKGFVFIMVFAFGIYTYNTHKIAKEPQEIVVEEVTPTYNYFPKVTTIAFKQETNLEKNGFINLKDIESNIGIELRYASDNNFTGSQVYPSIAFAALRVGTAEKLAAANEELYKLGFRIKVWDAYRPRRYQYTLRDAAEKQNPRTASYIASPISGSNHNRGTAVDITLTDLEGHEVTMPTDFDHFGSESSIHYTKCTLEQISNRELLGKTMEKHGFRRIASEWWHFDDVDAKDYELMDLDFIELYR